MIQTYPIHLFVSNPWNYNVMEDEEFNSLVEDIKKNGVKHKIIVRKKNDKYEVIDGDWKIKALKFIGFKDIPSELIEIQDWDDSEVRSYVRSVKIRGTKIDLIREAEHYLADYQESKLNMTDYSKSIGMDVSKVSRILKRNNLGLPAKSFVQNNNVSPTILDEILTARPDYQLSLIERAMKERWTVEDAKLAIKMGVTVTGEPIKGTERKSTPSDIMKMDIVDRCAISEFVLSTIHDLDKVKGYCESKGAINTCRNFDLVMRRLGKAKNEVDGARHIRKDNGNDVRTSDVSKWISSGSEDERKDKVYRVNQCIKFIEGLK